MKKKVISILLTAVLATGMAACGSNSNTAGNSAIQQVILQIIQLTMHRTQLKLQQNPQVLLILLKNLY